MIYFWTRFEMFLAKFEARLKKVANGGDKIFSEKN